MQRREPPLAIKLTNLEPGDVLLFLPSLEICNIQRIIMLIQSLFCMTEADKGGHYDTTHAAICSGFDEQGKPLLTHIGPDGYAKETILHYEGNEERAFMVFRHCNRDRREEIVKVADREANTKLKWKVVSVLRALFVRPYLDENRPVKQMQKALTEWTFCSKFTIECLKEAARRQKDRENIASTACPKSLESYLYYNPHYQMYVYTGKSAFKTIKAEIEKEIILIKSDAIREKYNSLLDRIRTELAGRNSMLKIQILLQEMIPLLKPFTSCSSIYQTARRRGIFIDRDFNHYSSEQIFSNCKKMVPSHQ